MGFLKKIFKGVKKVFKKVGKFIKKQVQRIGKFVGKLGIVGQIGLAILLPGVGGMLGKLASTLGAAANPILQGVGKVLQTAVNFGKTAGKVFSTVTDAVGGFVKEVGGGFLKKMGVSEAAIGKMGMNPEGGFQSWMDGIGESVGAVRESAAGILDPWKAKSGPAVSGTPKEVFTDADGKLADLEAEVKSTASKEQDSLLRSKYTDDVQGDLAFEADKNAAEELAEEMAAKTTEGNENFFAKAIKEAPQRIGQNFVDQVTKQGTNYLMSMTGLTPNQQQVETYSGGMAQITPVDTTPQLAQFMQPFQMGTVNTNYNALFDQFDQIYGVA